MSELLRDLGNGVYYVQAKGGQEDIHDTGIEISHAVEELKSAHQRKIVCFAPYIYNDKTLGYYLITEPIPDE